MTYSAIETIEIIVAVIFGLIVILFTIKKLGFFIKSKYISIGGKLYPKSHLECPNRYDIERMLNTQKRHLYNMRKIESKTKDKIKNYTKQILAQPLNDIFKENKEIECLHNEIVNIVINEILNIFEINNFPAILNDSFVNQKTDFIIVELNKYKNDYNFNILKPHLNNIIKFLNETLIEYKQELQTEKERYAQKMLKILRCEDNIDI